MAYIWSTIIDIHRSGPHGRSTTQTSIYSSVSHGATAADQPRDDHDNVYIDNDYDYCVLYSSPCKKLWTLPEEPKGRPQCWRPGNGLFRSAVTVIVNDGEDLN